MGFFAFGFLGSLIGSFYWLDHINRSEEDEE